MGEAENGWVGGWDEGKVVGRHTLGRVMGSDLEGTGMGWARVCGWAVKWGGGGLMGSNGEVMGEEWGREGVWAVGCDGEVGRGEGEAGA